MTHLKKGHLNRQAAKNAEILLNLGLKFHSLFLDFIKCLCVLCFFAVRF